MGPTVNAINAVLEPDPHRSAEQRRAGALVEIAARFLDGAHRDGPDRPVRTADRYQTVVHVDANLLTAAATATATATTTANLDADTDTGRSASATDHGRVGSSGQLDAVAGV